MSSLAAWSLTFGARVVLRVPVETVPLLGEVPPSTAMLAIVGRLAIGMILGVVAVVPVTAGDGMIFSGVNPWLNREKKKTKRTA